MAEVITTKLLEIVFDKLKEKALSEFAQLIGVDEELRKLESTLSTIQAVLEDAEKRQGKDKALKDWLWKLKDSAYDADDVLDDFVYEAKAAKLKTGTEAHMKDKVSNFLSLPKKIAFRRKIAQRVKEINKRLYEIAEERSMFHLEKEVLAGGSSKIESSTIREKIGFDIDDSKVYGRERDKEEIVEFLLNTSIGDDIGVICIVGLGGLGKTTLAQLVYQDERVCRHFEEKKSVVVSEESKIEKVIGLIIEPATGNNNVMQASLRQQLGNRRYLLVLDDVWSENQDTWDKLRDLLRVGAKGSKVIVTTRSERVASIMGTITPHRLSSLSLDDCWLLFERRAFPIGVERNPNLVSIGREIVNKCGGVPLAAKALGSVLRFKTSESEWQAIKDSEIWKLAECEILPALKLSYDHLSPCLKQCFAYCSIFSKDYKMDTDRLVKLWGAEGFLKPYDEHMHWEQIGLQYVDELLARSLFQKSMKGYREGYVTMHDLVHDLAQSVAGNECSTVDTTTGGCLSQNSRYAYFFIKNQGVSSAACQSLRDAKKLRTLYFSHLSGTKERVQEVFHVISSNLNFLRALSLHNSPLKALPDSLKKLKHIRYLNLSSTLLKFFPPCINTLHNLQTLDLSFNHIKSIPNSIANLHSLCTLDLTSTDIKSLPESICNLSNLHTLDLNQCIYFHKLPQKMSNMKSLCTLSLSHANIESLPESICTLSNLHTLNLNYCFSIHKLPQNMSNMKSLVNLDMECIKLTCIPRGLGKLNRLRRLPIFIVGGETNCSLEELGSMKLEGKLEIKELQNVRNVDEAKGANLSDKHSIQSLKLSWKRNSYKIPEQAHECDKDDDDDEREDEIVKIQHVEDVLKCLQPSKNLEALEINGYVGRTFPFWMMESSLSKLKTLSLDSLPLIKHLHGGANAFPSLKELRLRHLAGFEELCSVGSDQLFPCLEILVVIDCPKLKALLSVFNAFPSLKELKLHHLAGFEELYSVGSEQLFPCIEVLTLDNGPKLIALPSLFNAFSSLKKLELRHLAGFEELCSVGSEQLFPCLEILNLIDCPKLKALPSVFNAFPSLKQLELINWKDLEKWCSVGSDQLFPCLATLILNKCPKLKALPSDFPSVKTVHIAFCNCLRVFNAFPSLQNLGLHYLTGLEELCSVGSEQPFPCLEHLCLQNCPKLKASPSDFPSVKTVDIRNS